MCLVCCVIRAVVNMVNIILVLQKRQFLEQINDYGCLKEDNLRVFMDRSMCMFLLMCIKGAFDIS